MIARRRSDLTRTPYAATDSWKQMPKD